jgi:hypothetical protein
MEDWAAFGRSFTDFVELLGALAAPPDGKSPATISVLSGDIHFCYAAELLLRRGGGEAMSTKVHQLVSSPIRNALRPPESTAMHIGASRVARVIGRVLRRAAGRSAPPVEWRVDLGPVFANSVGELDFAGRSGSLLVLQTKAHEDDAPPKFDEGFRLDLCAGSRATALASAGA